MIKVKTEELKNGAGLISKVWLGTKLIRSSEYIFISVNKDKMLLLSSDIDNIVQVSIPVENPDTDVIKRFVSGEVFYRYVNLITGAREVNISLGDNSVILEYGKNRVEFETVSDEDSVDFIKAIPEPVGSSVSVDVKNLLSGLKVLSAANNTVDTTNIMSNFYIGAVGGLSTNNYRISATKKSIINLDEKSEFLIPTHLVNILRIFEGKEQLTFCGGDENQYLYFISDNIIVAGIDNPNLEQYPKNPILDLLKTAPDFIFKVMKSTLLNSLERLRLFIKDGDRGAIKVVVKNKELILNNILGNSEEVIDLSTTEEKEFSFESKFDINNLFSILEQISETNINIGFVKDKYIIIETEDYKYIAAIMVDA